MEAMLSAAGAVRTIEGGQWSLVGSGMGRAAIRGASTGIGEATARLSCVLDWQRTVRPAPSGAVVRSGAVTLTTRDGHRLRGTFAGSASSPDPAGFVDLTGELTITGGTGRFQTAVGAGTLGGTINIKRQTFCLTGAARLTLLPKGPRGMETASQ